jgi:hypothetical protein
MRRLFILVMIAGVVLVACQADPSEEPALPTLAVLPSATTVPTETASPTVTESPTPADTETPRPTRTPSHTPTNTPTETPIPADTATPEPTYDLTRAFVETATSAVEEAPSFATFTPAASDVIRLSTGTPQMVADLVINERQFQEEITRLVELRDDVESVEIDFIEEAGIAFNITAKSSEGALSTGILFIVIETTDGFARIEGLPLVEEGEVLSQEFVVLITGPFLIEVIVPAIDDILEQRLGDSHNLESIVMTDTEMLVSLLVPQQ